MMMGSEEKEFPTLFLSSISATALKENSKKKKKIPERFGCIFPDFSFLLSGLVFF